MPHEGRMNERPFLKKHNESNISGLYIIGDLAGAPVIKYAMAQGFEVIEHVAFLPGSIGAPTMISLMCSSLVEGRRG